MTIIVRAAEKTEIGALAEIEAASFEDAYPRFVLRQFHDLDADLLLVAAEDDRLLGYALGAIDRKGLAWLLSIAVLDAARGRGLARALLDELEKRLVESAARCIRATVAPGNEKARGLLERRGYQVIDEEADWFGPGEARLLVERESSAQ